MSSITIYKASAGSGKTYQLTGEYLKLIFDPSKSFKNILAVTFTNKATNEMRERILKELYNLSAGKPCGHAPELKKEFNLPDDELRTRARQLLNNILHNYGNFNVSTIDSFFQIILKSFIREIGLNAGFSIELNFSQVLESSIQQFLETIDNKPSIKKWLSEFAQHKIEEGKSWDIQKDLFWFSNEALTESFFAFSEDNMSELASLEKFEQYKKSLKEMLDSFIKQVNQFGRQGVNLMNQNGLSVEQFSQKDRGPAAYFYKLQGAGIGTDIEPNSYVIKANQSPDGLEGWVSKTSSDRFKIQQCVTGGLQRHLSDCIDYLNQNIENYLTASEIHKNLDVFAVIVEVYNNLLSYCHEKNIFLLSLAAPLLDKMIQDSDTPFIYEKTGTFLKHIMIDEFQDTSNLQWNNFYPLFSNSISQGNTSLVVGDVKQSIYRWRNSNWNLLHSQLKEQFAAFAPVEKNLPFNYRSEKNVVEFNNHVFKELADLVTRQADANLESNEPDAGSHKLINEIYCQANQRVPGEKAETAGFASIRFFDQNTDESTFQEKSLAQLINSLEQLFEKGYQPKDIAILVRQNKEGALVAKALMDYRLHHPETEKLFSFVSNDSVFLTSSVVINYLVSAIQYIADPSNKIIQAQLLYYYWMSTHSHSECARRLAEIDFYDRETYESYLPNEFVKKFNTLKQMPLVELTQELLAIFIYSIPSFNLAKHVAFIHTFQDLVLNYTTNFGVDVSGFIEWWNESANETKVSLSEEQNAIRILTIHKAKGLEYKAVLIPFADWKLDQSQKIIWCQTSQEPFNQYNLVPLTYSKKLIKTAFKSNYIHENLMAMVDSLNLLYVAFTRAEQALFVFAPKPAKPGEHKEVGSLLHSMVNNISTIALPGFNWDEQELLFETGHLVPQTGSWESFEETSYSVVGRKKKNDIKVKLTSTDFLLPDASDNEILLNRGKVYHSILENIQGESDLSRALEKITGLGLISVTESVSFEKVLKQSFKNPTVAEWFSGRWKVYTETSFLLPDGTIHRPDRVMVKDNELIVVDYKFTSKKQYEHEKQVRGYMESLKELEDKKVRGFLWYVLTDNICEVVI